MNIHHYFYIQLKKSDINHIQIILNKNKDYLLIYK